MPTVHHLPVVAAVAEATERAKYSFDMTQVDPRGFVLIDACVPYEMAIEFMNLLTLYSGG